MRGETFEFGAVPAAVSGERPCNEATEAIREGAGTATTREPEDRPSRSLVRLCGITQDRRGSLPFAATP